ncbi:Protein HID1 [Lepeophtheirus salmonis]|uniref:Protein HID1 n=1 Tax=Lepeophtheirus salmonis TaxID=72036 RepID=A0A7R8CHK3_LEPSM|nr:Protein HID1 [Lepeophtheirus salmonis]CAF2824859.1 Protein HID1 [Lepeophtheirus salmonis]
MGNADTKLNFRKAVIQLTTKTQVVESNDDSFWDQFWSDSVNNIQDVFALVPSAEIRALREEAPSNLATLCYKAVEKLVQAADSSCRSAKEQIQVLNSVRLLTRLIPYIFEDPDWRGFFWSKIPDPEGEQSDSGEKSIPLAHSMLNALCDLLFCPEFTVAPNKNTSRDEVDDFTDSRFFGGDQSSSLENNRWITYFTSSDNRHALPLFTSLLNIVCGYDPAGIIPYNHLLFNDTREETVEAALQVLIITLDQESGSIEDEPTNLTDNLFLNYLSRIHREEDFSFILKGVTRLLMNPLIQTYLPNSQRRVQFHQELLIFFWKFCEHNKKFLFYVLKSSDVLDILVPILHHLNDSRADQSKVGLMHIGVFILLLLSGERNFGVRLNKPYTATIPMDIPIFTGTHGDLLIIVFHKIITTGHQRLQPLFDCLLTILCNVSPYIKSLSMVAACKN